MKLKEKFLIQVTLFISGFTSVYGQVTIHGIVRDSVSNEALSYVNIGIKHKNIGTVSLRDGSFNLTIPPENKTDTLTFSMVGYNDYKSAMPDLSNDVNIKLKPKTEQLDEVVIKSPLRVEKKFGESNYHALVQFTDGSTNQKDIFEIAQLIHLDTMISKINSVNLISVLQERTAEHSGSIFIITMAGTLQQGFMIKTLRKHMLLQKDG